MRDWKNTEYARTFFEMERGHLLAGLKQSVGPSVLQLGNMLDTSTLEELELPFWVFGDDGTQTKVPLGAAGLRCDPAFLPFAPESFSTVVLPHILERHDLPHQILREAYRVAKPEGYVVITGFSPASFIGLQRWLKPKSVAKGRYYRCSRVIDWLKVLGFEVVGSSMYQYAPLSRGTKVRRLFAFMESVGDRWLPMMGGGYMIAAKKRETGNVMIGKLRFPSKQSKLVASAAAKHPKINSE